MTTFLTGFLSLLLLFSVTAAAGPSATNAAPAEIPGVTNSPSGKLDLDAFTELVIDNTMKRLDADKDGAISEEEARKAAASPDSKTGAREPAVDFKKADTDHDGKVSRAELKEAVKKQKDVEFFFDEADQDHNHFLDAKEMRDMKEPPSFMGVRFRF